MKNALTSRLSTLTKSSLPWPPSMWWFVCRIYRHQSIILPHWSNYTWSLLSRARPCSGIAYQQFCQSSFHWKQGHIVWADVSSWRYCCADRVLQKLRYRRLALSAPPFMVVKETESQECMPHVPKSCADETTTSHVKAAWGETTIWKNNLKNALGSFHSR